MGLSSKKSTSTQDTSGTSTVTPNVPQWGVDSLQGLNKQIEGIAGTDPSSFVAPATALQTQAFTGAGNLGDWTAGNTAANDLATQVGGAAAPHAGAVSSADSIAKFLNPELEKVVNTTLADFDQNAGATRASQAAKGAAAGAFGGSRWGLQEGETEGQLARARATADATLRSNAYTDAEGQANNDANRGQATNLANLSSDNSNLDRQSGIAALLNSISTARNSGQVLDATTQGALGSDQRAIDQSKATAPISLAQTVAQLLGQNQLPLLTGATTNSTGHSTGSTTSTPSTFSQIGQGIQTAANLAALFG